MKNRKFMITINSCTKCFLIAITLFATLRANAQTLFVPSGTSGIGTSSTSNVGIGIPAPIEKLHINGSIRGNQLGGALRVSTGSGYVDIGPQNEWWAHMYTDRDAFLFNQPVWLYSGVLSAYSTSDLTFQTNGTTRMRISSANGRVGIGPTSPRGIFDVSAPGDIVLSEDLNVGSGQTLYIPGQVYLSPYAGSNISYLQARRGNSSGTTSLRLRTTNNGSLTDAMHIEGDGDVGIGTITPGYKLDVAGAINATSLYVNGSPFNSIWSTSSSNIFYNIGNVGIGVDLPLEKLHINGSIRGSAQGGSVRINTLNGYVDIGPMTADASAFETDRAKFFFNKPLYVNGAINSSGSGNLVLRTGESDRITIQQTGAVGIGTSLISNPNNYRLAVNGNVGAHEVRVEHSSATWPDYVFSNDYNLPSLKVVEDFIKANNHLMDIPSASEVGENGHDLGNMDALLLKKIEELTLYVIEQEKKLDAQQKEIERLKRNNRYAHAFALSAKW